MTYTWPLAYFGAAFFSALFVILRVIVVSQRREQRRQKCFHQTHTEHVPRLGGLGLAVAYLIGASAYFMARKESVDETALTLVIGPLLMFGIGFWDDLRPLGARMKLVLQLVVATYIARHGLRIEAISNPFGDAIQLELEMLVVLVSVVWIVVLTNLINIIDGIDGLAGGISLMLMVLLITVCITHQRWATAHLALVAAGALLAFLYFNFPPAKVYMGDGGAYFLGCLIAVLAIHGSQKETLAAALAAPVLALGLPIIDVTLTLIRRGMKGLPIFRADRRHLHHRLVDKGFTHRRSVLTLYVLSFAFLVMALTVFWYQGKALSVVLGLLFVGVIFLVHSYGKVPQKYSVRHLWRELYNVRRETRYMMTLGQWLELEAERCDSPEELWENFQFLARKFDLFEVRLAVEEGELVWHNPAKYGKPVGELTSRHVPIHSDSVHGLDIVCEKADNPEKVFELKAELVTEAWVKAANRWRQSKQQEVRFASDYIRERDVAPAAS